MNGRFDSDLIAWAERIEVGENAAERGTARPLRDYQARAFDMALAAIDAGERRVLLQLPTGAGKTRIAAELIMGEIDGGGRILFAVPRLSLIEQTTRAFEAEGVANIGVIQGRHHRTNASARVQIATVQTLRRRSAPQGITLVIIDECHLRDKALDKVLASPAWGAVPVVGLSATPWSRGLGKAYTKLLRPISTTALIDQGYLVPLKIFCPPGPDLSGVKTRAGDYNDADLARAVDRTELVGDIIKTWLAKGDGRPTLVYGVDRAHARHLQERFIEAGIVADYIDGKIEQFDREDIFTRFRNGVSTVICSVACLDTGIDLPTASCLIDARPTKSEMKFVQTVGRGLRTAPGKDDCVLLDHSGNTRRLGLPLEIDFDRLDDGAGDGAAKAKRKAGSGDAIFCSECHAQQTPPKPRVCPQCGHVNLAVTLVREREGDLVEYGCNRPGKPAEASPETKATWHGALLRIARERGYKSGWVANQYREKFGHWPPRFPAPECAPTVEIRNWIRSRVIAYAKARARG
ncbi:MAG: DEAD/DEAH box helicase [Methylocella sp.]